VHHVATDITHTLLKKPVQTFSSPFRYWLLGKNILENQHKSVMFSCYAYSHITQSDATYFLFLQNRISIYYAYFL